MENTKINFRSKVFKAAWAMVGNTKKSFAVCLAKAWQNYRLTKLMIKQAVKFAYEKVDGSLRHAIGTLNIGMPQSESKRESSPAVVTYYDLDANAFRSFRSENLIAIY
jgi:hypothetical protein